jgi:glycosyltransferase involved in cell wall biosynthesis
MELPNISIVTPSLNQAKFLCGTIESVLSQDYPNLEYIIIDGASTDGSVDIIRRYEKHLTYWCSEEDKGQSDALMKGFNRATGELLAWVNSDDVLFPGCLKAIAECYLVNSAPDLVTANTVYIAADGSITRVIRVPRQSRFFLFYGVWHATSPAIFFKTSLFHKVGDLNLNYHQAMDLDIFLRMVKGGARIAHVPQYLAAWRRYEDTKTDRSLKSRSTREHPETTEILNRALAGSTPNKRFFWRNVCRVYRLLNSNYVLAYRDLRRMRGRHWREVFGNGVVS